MFKQLALFACIATSALAQQGQPGVVAPLTFPAPRVTFPAPGFKLLPSEPRALPAPCPVGIAAQPQGMPQSVWVASVEDATLGTRGRARTGVHVRLVSNGPQVISHLTVSVLYQPFAKGVLLTSAQPLMPQEKTFELDAADAAVLERNLLVGGNVDIRRVRVLKVVFADGTEWKASAAFNTCSVQPSHFIRVASR